MSVSVIDWLNQWLPFVKWLTVAALLFLFPLLLEACNRLRLRPLALSASQRHDVWSIALIVWALSPILWINEVSWSIPLKAAVPTADATRSISAVDLPLNRLPSSRNETIASEIEFQEEKTKTYAMESPESHGSKPLLVRMESKDQIGASSLSTFLGWQHAWLALCGGGTVLLLIRLVRAHVAASALVRTAELECQPNWIKDLMKRCSISTEIRLGWSESTRIPILVGWLRPVILLPREAQNWPPSKLESVLLHEHAHIQRADLQWLRVANLICAIYWVQPWVWIAAHRMRCLREEACDDMVIGFGKDRREYSEHLIQIAERATYPVSNVAGLGIARSTSLGDRIIAILDLRRSRARSSRRFKSMVCVALTILFGSVLLGIPNQAVGIAMPITQDTLGEIQDNGSMKKDEAEQSSDRETDPKPMQQIEKEIAEYKEIVTDFFQWGRVVQAPAIAKGLNLPTASHAALSRAKDKKKKEIIELHKALAIEPSTKLYEEARLRRIVLSIESGRKFRKALKSDDAPLPPAEQMADEEMSIELTMVSLIEALNTPVSSGKETIAKPVSQIDKEIAEYKQMVTAYFQYDRVVGTSRRIANLPPVGDDPLPAMYRAIQKKKEEIIELHEPLALVPSTKLYEEASARRIVLMIELNTTWRREHDSNNAPLSPAEQLAKEETFIELQMVDLTAELNAPQ